jgi:hypothetical protein
MKPTVDVKITRDCVALSLEKDDGFYLYSFSTKAELGAEQRTEILRTVGRQAANLELSFNWFDAALVAEKVREVTNTDGLPTAPSEVAVSKHSNRL